MEYLFRIYPIRQRILHFCSPASTISLHVSGILYLSTREINQNKTKYSRETILFNSERSIDTRSSVSILWGRGLAYFIYGKYPTNIVSINLTILKHYGNYYTVESMVSSLKRIGFSKIQYISDKKYHTWRYCVSKQLDNNTTLIVSIWNPSEINVSERIPEDHIYYTDYYLEQLCNQGDSTIIIQDDSIQGVTISYNYVVLRSRVDDFIQLRILSPYGVLAYLQYSGVTKSSMKNINPVLPQNIDNWFKSNVLTGYMII